MMIVMQEDSDGKVDDTIEWGDEGTSLAGMGLDPIACKMTALNFTVMA